MTFAILLSVSLALVTAIAWVNAIDRRDRMGLPTCRHVPRRRVP